jgi:hypothetical protein
MRGKGLLAAGLIAAALASPAPAQAAVTIGSNLTANPMDNFGCNAVDCTITNLIMVPASQASGGLTSPVNGTVTSWSFKSGSASGNPIRLRVMQLSGGTVFPSATGMGTSAPAADAIGVVGPNPASLPIKAGDSVGLDSRDALVEANTPGARQATWSMPPLADGSTRMSTSTFSNVEVLVQATVEPTNTIAFGAVTRNKKKGIATVTLTVPNPGQLIYAGTGVSVTGPASVAAPGDVQLTVRATGKKAKKLRKKGKVSVSFGTTFTPNFGTAGITPENLTLRKKRKK